MIWISLGLGATNPVSMSQCGSILVMKNDSGNFVSMMQNPETLELPFTESNTLEGCQRYTQNWLVMMHSVVSHEVENAMEYIFPDRRKTGI